jgi:hypothetical protein
MGLEGSGKKAARQQRERVDAAVTAQPKDGKPRYK